MALDAAGGILADVTDLIPASCRTFKYPGFFHIAHPTGPRLISGVGFIILGPFLFGRIDFHQIVYAQVAVGGLPRFQKTRRRNHNQQDYNANSCGKSRQSESVTVFHGNKNNISSLKVGGAFNNRLSTLKISMPRARTMAQIHTRYHTGWRTFPDAVLRRDMLLSSILLRLAGPLSVGWPGD